MRMSNMVGKTLKKTDDEFTLPSQSLLIRSGMFRSIDSGRYTCLPLGSKVLNKLVDFIGKSLEEKGFQKVFIPQDDNYMENLCLTLRNEIKSYKELPAYVYGVNIEKREEGKVKDGLLKAKEYVKIKGVSFHESDEGLPKFYDETIEFYKKLLEPMNLKLVGLSGYNSEAPDRVAHRFFVEDENGDNTIYKCTECGYTALEEIADFNIEDKNESTENHKAIEEIYTPDIKTIKELEDFLGIDSKKLAKTMLVKVRDGIVAVVIRGDRELNLYKLSKILNVSLDEISMAEEEDINSINTYTGFVGPVGLENAKIIIDKEIANFGTYIAGANKKDYHIKNVSLSRDVKNYMAANVTYIKENDKCHLCGGSLNKEFGIGIGGIYSLGNIDYVKSFSYKNNQGKEKELFGIYHFIDVYGLLSIIAEKNHDKYGIIWPARIAPYQAIVSVLNSKVEEKMVLGEKIYNELKAINLDVLFDDRNERAGAKFNDADLLGIPARIVLGKKTEEGIIEYKVRWEKDKEELKVEEAIERTIDLMKEEEIL